MAPVRIAHVGAMLLLAACGRPVGTDDLYPTGAVVDPGLENPPIWEGAIDEPHSSAENTGGATSCAAEPLGPSDAPGALEVWRLADLQIALPHGTPTAEVPLQGPAGLECQAAVACALQHCSNTVACGGSAMTFSQTDAAGAAEGFVAIRAPVTETPVEESAQIFALLDHWLGPARVTLLSSGVEVRTPDGSPGLAGVTVELRGLVPTALSVRRDRILATLLGLDTDQLGEPPGASGPEVGELVLANAVQKRSGPDGEPVMALVGSVSGRQQYHATMCHSRLRVQDAANGTALAGPHELLHLHTEEQTVSTGGKADIIWVIDESESMSAERYNVADNAVKFFEMALDYGLDFRMGVVDVHQHNGGRFYTGVGQSGDRFLGPGELYEFSQCAISPWGSGVMETGAEYGITQGYNALLSHLPRANLPNRIRPGATVTIIYVSDETANELFDECNYPWNGSGVGRNPCVQQVIAPTVDLLLDVDPSGRRFGRAHAIVGPQPLGCETAEMGAGYLELVAATGGQVGSVCQADLHTTLQMILEDIAAAASPNTLIHIPVASSLRARRNGLPFPRDSEDGFDYRISANSLILTGHSAASAQDADLLVHYYFWSPSSAQAPTDG